MLLSDAGQALLKVQEGIRLTKYYDTKGIPTIGVGHNMRASPKFADGKIIPDKINGDQVKELFKADVEKHEATLFAQIPWAKELDVVRRDVLINMCFNLGAGRFPKKAPWSNIVKQIREGDYKAAAKAMLDTAWASQVGMRSKRLAELIKEGAY